MIGVRGWLVAVLVAVGLATAPVAQASNPLLIGSISGASGSSSLSGAVSVAVSGTHAYTTAYYAGQLTAVDFSNPSSPFISGSSPASNSVLDASTVNIAGGFAYVVSKNRNGTNGSGSNDDGTGNTLSIFNISTNPAVPTLVGSVTDTTKLFGAYGVAVSGNYAYIAAQGCVGGQPCPNPTAGNSFEVVDISHPAAPAIVASLANSALPAPWNATNALLHACSVTVSGHYAYVTAAYSNRLTIVDISTPTAPAIVSSLQDASNLDFPVDVAVKGNYAYVADQATPLGRVAVVDVSNPASPSVVASVTDLATMNGAYRIRVRGSFAYVSASSVATVTAIDISDPLIPREVAHVTNTTDLNKTTGLDLDPAGRYLVASSPWLTSQANQVFAPYSTTADTGSMSVIQLDPAPIAASIASGPANPTTQTGASFTFSTTDAISTVLCSLDGAPLGFCTSATTQQYAGLARGLHTFMVQAADAAGNTSSASYSWMIDQVPFNTVSPSISGPASPSAGAHLTAAAGTWGGVPAPSFAYQWSDCDVNGANCTAISSATSPAYMVQASDAGSTLEVTVTGSNGAGSSSATSRPTATIAGPTSPPVNTALPLISGPGVPSVGDQLAASNGTWTGTPGPRFGYRWSDCDVNGANCLPISGATSSSYTAQRSDAGATLEVTVTATNSAGSSAATSARTGVVTAITPMITGLHESAQNWRVGSKLAQITAAAGQAAGGKRPPVGTTFSFTLNVPASVEFAFSEDSTGRKVKGTCRRKTAQDHGRPHCEVDTGDGKLVFVAHPGARKVSFEGRISHSHKLRPGHYDLTLTATAAGKASTTKTIEFTIAI